jgi:dolichyl-phosphate beta-glucosyltransferase
MNITIILPIYNEEKNLQKGVLDKVLNFAKQNKQIKQVLVVNDGSLDQSEVMIKSEYLGKYPKLSLLNKEHSGKAYTVIAGIKAAKGDYVLFSDIDLATPIEEADKLIKCLPKYKLVIGSRNSQRQGAPLFRKIMALGMIVIRSNFIGLKKIHDTQCGFKLFEKKAAIKIINNLRVFKSAKKVKGSSVSAGFDLEFLFVAQRLGYKIKEIPVVWRHVETKNVSFVKDSYESLRDILKIKWFSLLKRYDF